MQEHERRKASGREGVFAFNYSYTFLVSEHGLVHESWTDSFS